MAIYYCNPADPNDFLISGGTRKLIDHSVILNESGFTAWVIYNHQINSITYHKDDLLVFPEVYGNLMQAWGQNGIRRVSFAQNGHLIERWHSPADPNLHAYNTCPDLVAILTESEHTTKMIQHRFPNLSVPVIRTHSSGNGRAGRGAGFEYGNWPRPKRIGFFDYKHEELNKLLMENLPIPPDWEFVCFSGHSDAEIAELYRQVSIFVAPNIEEGMCAPTSEAMISGAVIVGWPGATTRRGGTQPPEWTWEVEGAGPMEYLQGRGVIAPQDDMEALRQALIDTVLSIEERPHVWAMKTQEWSDWFQATYSREGEIDEIVRIMEDLHGRR